MSNAFNERLVTSLLELSAGSSDEEWRASHRVNEAAFGAIAGDGPVSRGTRVDAARRAGCIELVFWVLVHSRCRPAVHP